MIAGLVLLLALPGSSPGGDEAAEPVIGAILVEGARDEAARESALGVFGMRAGEPLDPTRVRRGVKRVFLTGPWADVQVSVARADGQGGDSGEAREVVLFLRLVPDVIVADIAVQAPPGLPQDRMLDAARLEIGERFRPERVDEAAERVRAAMAELGYPRARVDVDSVELTEHSRKVRLRIDPGAPVRLRALRIEGNPMLSRREIEELLGVEPGEAFDRPRLEQGLERVRALLLRRRHLGASVRVLAVTADQSRTSAEVSVLIEAGPRYRIRYVGNHVLSTAALRTVLHEGKLEGIEPLALTRARAALESAYRLAGYARVKVQQDEAPAQPPYDEDAERELRFFIEEGPRAEVTEVIIAGAHTRKTEELVEEVWNTVSAETPAPGLLQSIDRGDVDDLLSNPTGRGRSEPRPFEVSDEGIELLPRPFIGRKPVYIERAFMEGGRRIADLYRSDGYLDVNVKGPFPEFSEDGRRIRVRYQITEGPRVTVSAVRFVDARPCAEAGTCTELGTLPFAALLEEVKLAPGQPASWAAVAEARATLERNLQDRGHPFARVTEGIERLHDRPEIDLVYTVDPGPRVTVGKVRIKGNSRTRDLVILDRVTLEPGDLYSAGEVERSRQRLARLGLFSSVSIELLDDDPRARVRDLLVVVKERPQFAVEVGAGASIEDGPRAFLAGEVRNIFGLGLGVRGRGQLNYPRAFYDFIYDPADPNNPLQRFEEQGSFVLDWGQFFEGQAVLTGELPKVYGMPFDTRLHVDGVAMREIRPAFTLNRASALAGLGLSPAAWLQVAPQVEAELSQFDCPKDLRFGQSCGEGSEGLTRRLDNGWIRQITYRLTSAIDLRDHPIRPRSGVWLSGAADLAFGTGKLGRDGANVEDDVNSDFLKLTAAAVGYVPLSPSFVWVLSGRAGGILGINDDQNYIPLYKRFFLGGTSSIRGFREDQVLVADEPNRLGGSYLLFGRSELRVGIIGDLELGTFVDVGELVADPASFDPSLIAAGAGVGLRYNTPVGPFAVDLGWKVLEGRRRLPPFQSLERVNLHLSIGYF
jgi:outer membrane protein insertion porin family